MPRPIQHTRRDRWSRESEEHTSELQSPQNLVCRLLLGKKQNNAGVNLAHLLVPGDALLPRACPVARWRVQKADMPAVAGEMLKPNRLVFFFNEAATPGVSLSSPPHVLAV